jgi:hypothetical protein
MINANVSKVCTNFWKNAGSEPGISSRQSEILLESLHDGASIDVAVANAEIDTSHLEPDFIVQLARAIGTALGRVNRNC